MKLEGITNGVSLEGVEPSTVVTVVAASWPGIEAAANEIPEPKKQLDMFGDET